MADGRRELLLLCGLEERRGAQAMQHATSGLPKLPGTPALLAPFHSPLHSRCRQYAALLDECVPPTTTPPHLHTLMNAALLGLDEYERQLKEALRAAFEARAAAYTEEVRRLMAGRLDPAWSFPALFLAKDGLAGEL